MIGRLKLTCAVEEKFEKEAVPETYEFKFICKFDCYPKCCSNVIIFLTPYDIDNISQYLSISNGELIKNYCRGDTEGNSLFPICILDTNPCCKFNKKGICEIYPARPLICRLYPVGRSYDINNDKNKKTKIRKEKFVIDEGCRGVGEGRTYTIKSFLKEQGVDKYTKIMRMFNAILEKWCVLPESARLKLNRTAATICYYSKPLDTQFPEKLFIARMKNLRNLITASIEELG
ncbi:MAG: YkgJ family cysteine cluster protein [Methanocellales archaeon]